MRKKPILKTILNNIGIKTGTFTADADTDKLTSSSHGLKDRDLIVLSTTDTLPAGLATNTVYIVEQADTDTFKLKKKSDNTHPDITDAGTGTHTFTMHDVGWSINTQYYKNKEVIVDSDGGGDAEMTIKFQGSWAEDEPDFSAAQAKDNQWEYLQIKDLQSGSTIAGDTGISFSGADDHRAFNIENNTVKWINCIISNYTAGEVTVKLRLNSDS